MRRFSDESFSNSVYTNECLFDYIERGKYSQDDYETRKNNCLSILTDLEDKGIIERGSIYAET